MKMIKSAVAVLALLSAGALAGEREASGTVQISATSGKIIITLSGSNANCGNRYWLEPEGEYNQTMICYSQPKWPTQTVWVNGSGDCLPGYPLPQCISLG